jgi:hypothetical protein
MAGIKLDGAGQAKMATLDRAITAASTLHVTVERMAMAVKSKQPLNSYLSTFKRTAAPMVGLLKGQFGMISDQVAATIIVATKTGGGDPQRLRGMREGVAGIKVALEIAVNQTKEKHLAHEHKPDEPAVPAE